MKIRITVWEKNGGVERDDDEPTLELVAFLGESHRGRVLGRGEVGAGKPDPSYWTRSWIDFSRDFSDVFLYGHLAGFIPLSQIADLTSNTPCLLRGESGRKEGDYECEERSSGFPAEWNCP